MRIVLPLVALTLASIASSAAAQPREVPRTGERPGSGVAGSQGAAGAGTLSGGSPTGLDVRGTIRSWTPPGASGCCVGQGGSDGASAPPDDSAADRAADRAIESMIRGLPLVRKLRRYD
jgi:hypothetical protein